jgi:FkbM family methyltransferase
MRPLTGLKQVSIPDRHGNRILCPSLREPIAAALFSDGTYEPATIDIVVSHLPRGGTFVDVGANIGTIALAIAALRPDARIICVEAAPPVASILRRNIELNRRANVTVVEALVGAEELASVPFYQAPESSFGMGSLGPQFHAAPTYIAQRRLDEILDSLGCDAIDVVKLDIEGAEAGALKGMSRHLAGARRPFVIFEFLDWAETRIAGQAAGDAQRFLRSLGYDLWRLDTRTGLKPLADPIETGGAMICAVPGVLPVN